jgi:hypothetical protein
MYKNIPPKTAFRVFPIDFLCGYSAYILQLGDHSLHKVVHRQQRPPALPEDLVYLLPMKTAALNAPIHCSDILSWNLQTTDIVFTS